MKKYPKIKILFAVLVLVSGAWLAWQISTKTDSPKNLPLVQTEILPSNDSNFNFNASGTLSATLPTIADLNSDQSSDNLTDTLAKLYAQQILSRNSSGPTTDANGQPQLTVPAENVFENILQQNLNQKIQFKEFTINDIKISTDNSQKNQIDYIQTLNTITQKNFSDANANVFAALDKFLNKNDSSVLQNQIEATTNQIHDVLALSVPSLWQQFDVEALNLWQKTTTVYQAFLGLNDDPLKTYLTLNDFQKIFQEAQSLNTILINRYQDLTLKK